MKNAVTQRNLNTCRELGWTIVEPESGMLACGDAGKGRMEEPARIETAVEALLLANRPDGELPLKGLAVLVTAARRRSRLIRCGSSPTIPPARWGMPWPNRHAIWAHR